MNEVPQPDRIAVTVTYLEMTSPPSYYPPLPVGRQIALLRTKNVPLHFYRYLMDRVGRKWHWVNALRLGDEELAAGLATAKERPEYVAIKGSGPRPGGGPKLGIRPGYGDDADGVLVEGVGPGEPAAKAGIKDGDRIVEMGGKKIKNLEAYMVFMKEQKLGTTIDVTVLREKKELKLKVKLE